MRVIVISLYSVQPDNAFTDEFTITLMEDCANAVLTRGGEIPAQTYVDSEAALIVLPPYTYNRDVAECPLTGSIVIDAGTGDVPYDASNANHAWVSSFITGVDAPYTDAA